MAIIWTNLNSLHLTMILESSVEFYLLIPEKIYNCRKCILTTGILLLSSNGKGHSLYFNKFEFPWPKHALCQIWLNFRPVVLEKKILNAVNVSCCFAIISPWKRAWPFIPTNLNDLWQVWMKMTQLFRRRGFLKLHLAYLNNFYYEWEYGNIISMLKLSNLSK